MKHFIVLVALGLYFWVTSTNSVLPQQKLSDDNKCETVGVKCTNCSFVAICTASGADPLVMPCTGATPYCNDNACAAKPSSQCGGGTSSTFICPANDGHYPDPNDCREYHICIDEIPYDYTCEGNAVYSTETHSCVRQSIQNPCSTVNCKGKNGQFAPYPSDHRYAFFCLQGNSTGIMSICGNDQEYDAAINKCKPHCTKEGLIADPESKNNFIECTLGIGTNYKITERQCPNSSKIKSKFDPVKLECVLSK